MHVWSQWTIFERQFSFHSKAPGTELKLSSMAADRFIYWAISCWPGKTLFLKQKTFSISVSWLHIQRLLLTLPGSCYQPVLVLRNFSFPDMISVLKKTWEFKLHLCIYSLDCLACLGRANRDCGSWYIVQISLGREDLLSLLLECSCCPSSSVSPFRNLLS